MTQVVGIVDIVWQGKNIPVEKGAKYKPSAIKNNPVEYGRKVGRAQEFKGGEATATTAFEKGQRLSDLYTCEEGELQVHLDTGQVYVHPDAFLSDVIEITGGEGGKVQLKWSFGPGEEIIA